MAAAYRVVDRLHAPLTSPLEDVCAATAHLKVYWPTSFQKLQETVLGNVDYTIQKPHSGHRDVDDLIILNIYKTNDPSTCWGLGPSPLSPLFIFYPAPHPADRSLSSRCAPPQPKPSIFSSFRNKPTVITPPRPNILQHFLDRKDFSTHDPTTVVCVRFLEEFVEWRLIPTSATTETNIATSSTAALLPAPQKPFLEKIGLWKPPPSLPYAAPKDKDTLAATIFMTPSIRPVDMSCTKTLVNLFTSLTQDPGISLYTTVEEVEGWPGVKLYFSQGQGGKRTYWWIRESASWRCVYDPTDKTEWDEGWKVPAVGERKETKETSRFGEGRPRKGGGSSAESAYWKIPAAASKNEDAEITCGTVKLYGADELEPVASIELATGQMWVVKNIVIETIDISIAIMFAVINLERCIKDEHDLEAGNRRFSRRTR